MKVKRAACPLCGKPTLEILGATLRLDPQKHLTLLCLACWDKIAPKQATGERVRA